MKTAIEILEEVARENLKPVMDLRDYNEYVVIPAMRRYAEQFEDTGSREQVEEATGLPLDFIEMMTTMLTQPKDKFIWEEKGNPTP